MPPSIQCPVSVTLMSSYKALLSPPDQLCNVLPCGPGSYLDALVPMHFPFSRFHELSNILSINSFILKCAIKYAVGFCCYKLRTLTDASGYYSFSHKETETLEI